MTLENVCNTDFAVAYSNLSGPPDLVYTGDVGLSNPSVSTTTSTKCKALAKGICTTQIRGQYSLATGGCPFTSATYTFNSGNGIITATTIKTKAEGQYVMRENDDNLLPGCIGFWNLSSPPYTISNCNCEMSVASAGQSKVKSE